MSRPLLALAAALALGACSTATTYAPEGYGGQRGGYAEQRLQTDRYRVSFSGNALTSRETVETYLLYRAAELTVQNGGDWFEADNRATDRERRLVPTGPTDPFGPYGFGWGPSWRYWRGSAWGPWGPWGNGFDSRFDLREVNRYEASAEIVIHRGQRPDRRDAYDAREVIANLGPRIQRPEATGR